MDNKRSQKFMHLAYYKMARDAVPDGGGLADTIQLFTEKGRLSEVARNAFEWVDEVLAVVKTAPDNPYGDDDEAILSAILERLEGRT